MRQDDFGSMNVGLYGRYGALYDEPNSYRGRKMEHDIAVIDRLSYGGVVLDTVNCVFKIWAMF